MGDFIMPKNDMMKTFKIVFLFLVLFLITQIVSDRNPQSIAPGCFSQEDCYERTPEGYCGIDYDCIQGQCFSKPVTCPEICNNKKDDDMDGLTDCNDNDCYTTSEYCSCIGAPFNICKSGRCYCTFDQNPAWVVEHSEEGIDSYCMCR